MEVGKVDRVDFMQGCGDLTMNEWNVAFVTGKSFEEVGEDQRKWQLLHAPGEPLSDRIYTCLIRWKVPKDDEKLRQIAEETRVVYPYQIAPLKFMVPSLDVGPPDRHVFLGQQPIGHLIEFAVYGQQVCRDGHGVPVQSTIHEFGDVRHVFDLPDLNRDQRYADAASYGIPEYEERPRNLFNQSTRDDVWLAEAALIQGDRNLKALALEHPVHLDLRALGAPKEWIEIVLLGEQARGYQKVEPELDVRQPGQWRWIVEGRRTWLKIFFLRSHYPCTMIGVRAKDEGTGGRPSGAGIVDCAELFFLAHGHRYDQGGCTIEEAARYLWDANKCWNALLFDEGFDVFQLVREEPQGPLVEKVPLKRRALRCVFWGTAK